MNFGELNILICDHLGLNHSENHVGSDADSFRNTYWMECAILPERRDDYALTLEYLAITFRKGADHASFVAIRSQSFYKAIAFALVERLTTPDQIDFLAANGITSIDKEVAIINRIKKLEQLIKS